MRGSGSRRREPDYREAPPLAFLDVADRVAWLADRARRARPRVVRAFPAPAPVLEVAAGLPPTVVPVGARSLLVGPDGRPLGGVP